MVVAEHPADDRFEIAQGGQRLPRLADRQQRPRGVDRRRQGRGAFGVLEVGRFVVGEGGVGPDRLGVRAFDPGGDLAR
ncbi:hypothetical protein OG738_20475 [Amycolatopsis sp. NBC_01488]|uniref:hypothetical protein n=1 Tax=Amycolatopsis sp. NBC_01488 TaxID=2903563 RepID=UPI002E2D5608|nr:hypothetical protein [Amycolatopsis sp. NBC_01488]